MVPAKCGECGWQCLLPTETVVIEADDDGTEWLVGSSYSPEPGRKAVCPLHASEKGLQYDRSLEAVRLVPFDALQGQ